MAILKSVKKNITDNDVKIVTQKLDLKAQVGYTLKEFNESDLH